MNRQELFILIDKWMKGEATEQEIKSLMNYYYSFRDTPEWDELQLGDKHQLEAEMEQRLLAGIRQTPPETVPVRRIWWPRVAVAAVLVLLLGAGWMFQDRMKKLTKLVQNVQLVTLPGQHRQAQLPDGTQVWLSPASTLQYIEYADSAVRKVWLTGEAFFEVAQDEDHPFVIVTGGMRTTVLGTSFNIQAYAAQPGVGLTVVTGKVAISATHVPGTFAKKRVVAVSPGQSALFTKGTQSIQVTDHADTAQLLLRRTGILKYKGTPVQEVVGTLGNYYNVNITIEGPTEDCFYFGEFNTHQGLEKALQQLCLTLNATLVKKDATYIIRKGRC